MKRKNVTNETARRSVAQVIAEAIKRHRVKDGLVLCDLCDTPASLSLSTSLSWTGCAICVWGEASSFDEADLIPVDPERVRRPADAEPEPFDAKANRYKWPEDRR